MSQAAVTNEQILEAIRGSNADLTKRLSETENNILTQLGSAVERISNLERKNSDLEKELHRLDKTVRKNNLLLFGLEFPSDILKNRLLELALSTLNSHLELQLTANEISDIYTLGKSPKAPVKIEFVSFLTKLSVLNNAKKLVGSKIFLDRDRTSLEREEKRILVKHLQQFKKQGKSAYIKGDQLYVNNHAYSANDLNELSSTMIREEVSCDPGTSNTKSNTNSNTSNKRKDISPLADQFKHKSVGGGNYLTRSKSSAD